MKNCKTTHVDNNKSSHAAPSETNAPAPSDFAMQVYAAVKRVPCGKVATYAQIALMAGRPNAARAVGNALHRNPYFGEVPCHRVVNAQGMLAQAFVFGGVNIQQQMLESEGVIVADNRVNLERYQFRG